MRDAPAGSGLSSGERERDRERERERGMVQLGVRGQVARAAGTAPTSDLSSFVLLHGS